MEIFSIEIKNKHYITTDDDGLCQNVLAATYMFASFCNRDLVLKDLQRAKKKFNEILEVKKVKNGCLINLVFVVYIAISMVDILHFFFANGGIRLH